MRFDLQVHYLGPSSPIDIAITQIWDNGTQEFHGRVSVDRCATTPPCCTESERLVRVIDLARGIVDLELDEQLGERYR